MATANGKGLNKELVKLRLDLVDRLAPYEITGKDLIPYDDEVRAILSLPENEQKKRLNRLVDKIRSQYKDRRA